MTDLTTPTTAAAVPAVSVVVPVRNEAGNVAPLIEEIVAVLDGRWSFEIVYVDDGSRDETPNELTALLPDRPWLRVLTHNVSCGQSSAILSGVIAARGAIVVMLDGDGQNDPRFIPDLIQALEQGGGRVGLAAGQRVERKATWFKKAQSRIANRVRNMALRDNARDTGCGLKVMRRGTFLRLPYFDGLHRFLPALVKRDGYDVAFVDVVDRPRLRGTSNYGLFDRLLVGVLDLGGVWWLKQRRTHIPSVTEVKRDAR
jgi:glycosyltransferase involved in cell wall biosynthesis